MDVAVAHTGAHDALVAGLDERFGLNAFNARVVVDDADLREALEVRHVKGRLVVDAQGLHFIADLAVEDRAETAVVAALEGFGLHRVGLDDVAGADDGVVHRDDDAEVGRFLRGGRQNGVVEVARTVGGETRGGKHGAHHDDRLRALLRELQEVGRFFHRVGAVRDDEAVILAAVLVDRLGEREPDFVGHVLRTDLGDLNGRDVRDFG